MPEISSGMWMWQIDCRILDKFNILLPPNIHCHLIWRFTCHSTTSESTKELDRETAQLGLFQKQFFFYCGGLNQQVGPALQKHCLTYGLKLFQSNTPNHHLALLAAKIIWCPNTNSKEILYTKHRQGNSKDTTIKDCMYMYAICVSIFSIIIMIVTVVQCHHSCHVAWSSTLLTCNIAQTKKLIIICAIPVKKSRQFGLISRMLWWAASLHYLLRTKLTKKTYGSVNSYLTSVQPLALLKAIFRPQTAPLAREWPKP
jgi:hypothetical protein